jgi:hypothetical protein
MGIVYKQNISMTNIVTHNYQGFAITQKERDSYVSLTDMAKAAGKLVADYLRIDSTKEYLEALSYDMGIPISSLIHVVQGKGKFQGTWAHPEIAIDFASWCNVQFRIWANRTLHRGMTNSIPIDDDLLRTKKCELKAARVELIEAQILAARAKALRLNRFREKPVKPIAFAPSIVAWVDSSLKPDPDSKIYIGVGNKKGTLSYAYQEYCALNNFEPAHFQRFSAELLKYARHGKGWEVRKLNHDRIGTPMIGLSFI